MSLRRLVDKNEEYLVKLAKKLVDIDTSVPPGKNYSKIFRLLEDELKEQGIATRILTYPIKTRVPNMELIGDRKVLIALLKGSKPTRSLILNGHVDVVPAESSRWSTPPFKATIQDGKIFGRGAADMKGSIASMILSLKIMKEANFKLRNNLYLAFTADEEIGCYTGIDFLIDEEIFDKQSSFCLSGDGDIAGVALASLGAVQFSIQIEGRSGHSACEWEAVNAIEKALRVVDAFTKLKAIIAKRESKINANPELKLSKLRSCLSTTMIHGGIKANIVPDLCTFTVDRRYVPEEDVQGVIDEVNMVLSKIRKDMPEISIKSTHSKVYDSMFLSPTNPFVLQVATVMSDVTGKKPLIFGVQGSTDVARLNRIGIPCLLLGPMRNENNVHSVDENVRIEDLKSFANILLQIYLRILC